MPRLSAVGISGLQVGEDVKLSLFSRTFLGGEHADRRYMEKPALSKEGLRATPQVWGAAVAVLVFQMPFTYPPFMQGIFKTASIGVTEWSLMFKTGTAVFLVVEAEKALARRMGGYKGWQGVSR